MSLPIGATGGPAYPTQRATAPEGWHFETIPLTFGRGRIVLDNGDRYADEFW